MTRRDLAPPPKPPVKLFRIKINNRLKKALQEKNISQVDCAKLIGVSARHLNRLVAGDIPKLDVAYLLEAALEIPVHDLFAPATKTVTVR